MGKSQGKAVPALYGAVTTALLVVIAAVALILQPPAPPAVAEFAPRADETIDEAPESQSSQFGSGEGGACAVGMSCTGQTTTTTTVAQREGERRTVEAARVHRCIGSPARQIEDPQSPPCVGYWEGDNGGATSRGVTAHEIRVAWPRGEFYPIDETTAFVDFVNRRFELYGRTIRLVEVDAVDFRSTTSTEQLAVADAVAERQVFASLPYPQLTVHAGSYYNELARRGIVGVDSAGAYRSEGELAAGRPYLWNVRPSYDRLMREQGDWMCTTLAGNPARKGGPDVATRTREFGLVVVREEAGAPDPGPLVDALGRCGERFHRTVEVRYGAPLADWAAAMGDFRNEGVTSVVCLCSGEALYGQLVPGATRAGFFPELVLTGLDGQDDEARARTVPADHAGHIFGLSSRNRVNRYVDAPWYWAAREGNPDYDVSTYGGAIDGTKHATAQYEAVLLLASGIQMAGPQLTPETFERGLLRTRFPNPGAGAAPYFQATVGFQGDHTWFRDIAMVWWNVSEPSVESNTRNGTFCYIGRGTRWSSGRWPDAEPRFDATGGPCR